MMGSAQLRQAMELIYLPTLSLKNVKRLRMLHSLCMPNSQLDDCKKSLLLKYNNAESFTEYEVYLIGMLIEVGI